MDGGGLGATLKLALSEREGLLRRRTRGGIRGHNHCEAVLVAVVSDRRAPSAVDVVKEAARAALASGGLNGGARDGEMRGAAGSDSFESLGPHGVLVPQLYRLVAAKGARRAWDSLRSLLRPPPAFQGGDGDTDPAGVGGMQLLAVCGLNSKSDSCPGYVQPDEMRLAAWILEEASVVLQVHAPRMNHSQGMTVLVTVTAAPTHFSVYDLTRFTNVHEMRTSYCLLISTQFR